MRDLRQTGDIIVYLAEMDHLNALVKLSESEIIDFIQCRIKDILYYNMKFYRDLKSDPDQWRHKLIEIGTIRRVPDTVKPPNPSKSSKVAHASSFKKQKSIDRL